MQRALLERFTRHDGQLVYARRQALHLALRLAQAPGVGHQRGQDFVIRLHVDLAPGVEYLQPPLEPQAFPMGLVGPQLLGQGRQGRRFGADQLEVVLAGARIAHGNRCGHMSPRMQGR
ncbi:hypothetical protein D3C78_1696700 [compost metagenome]